MVKSIVRVFTIGLHSEAIIPPQKRMVRSLKKPNHCYENLDINTNPDSSSEIYLETKEIGRHTRNIFENIKVFAISSYSFITNILKESVYFQSFCGFLIPSIAVLYSLTVTAWPQHNVILYPEYWYEPLGPFIVGKILVTVTAGMLDCSVMMNITFIWSQRIFLKMFLVNTLGFLIPYIGIYVAWVYILGYRHPMPFIGQLCWLIGFGS